MQSANSYCLAVTGQNICFENMVEQEAVIDAFGGEIVGVGWWLVVVEEPVSRNRFVASLCGPVVQGCNGRGMIAGELRLARDGAGWELG